MQNFQFDYVIIGGGGAGAVLARRLAELSSARIALLEAGPSDEANETVKDFRRYREVGLSSLARPVPVLLPVGQAALYAMPTSRVLGGSTSRNTCIWFKPPASDFDDWQTLSGSADWGAANVAPHFDALEARINVETMVPEGTSHDLLWQATREHGYAETDFSQAFDAGIGRYRMSKKGTARQSASVVFLHPLASLPANLTVFTETEVQCLEIDEQREVRGVITNRGLFSAAKEVVLCAGAIDTPKLLMLSGIGDAAALREMGIAPVVDLPGVGAHLLDHPAACVNFESLQPISRDPVWNYTGVVFAQVAEAGAWPDIEMQIGAELFDQQTLQAGYPSAPHGFTTYMSVNRAKSEGSVRLKSADYRDHPFVDTAYYTDPQGYDLAVMTAGLRETRALFANKLFDGWRGAELAPGNECQSDDEIAAYLRETTLTGYHPAGTCRMGSGHDPRSVVDPALRVIGVSNLRVADASVMPSMVSVNIAACCMMIGHKAASLLAE